MDRRMNGQSEQAARVRINSMIEAAGFKTVNDGADGASVGYEGDLRDADMRTRLAGKKPDYHFYAPNSTTPMAFLEAKKYPSRLDDALDQAAEYAKIASGMDKPNMIVLASDGIQVWSRHADGIDLTLNGYPVDFIPSPSLMRNLVYNPAAGPGKAAQNVKSLIQLFKKASGLMHSDGIDAGIARLSEFCALLFIKIMSERGNADARERWGRLLMASEADLIETYQTIHQEYQDAYPGIFSASQIEKPEILKQIVSALDSINFTASAMDVKGEAFEYFLSEYNAGGKSELGQYFTPRHITSMMAALLDPQPNDKILDPFCGSGGMLISMYAHIWNGLTREDRALNSVKMNQLKRRSLYGNDNSAGASSLAKMNMIILGDGHSNIQRSDSFDSLETNEFDKVITNIPFNLEGPVQNVQPFERASGIALSDWNYVCVVKCIESLRSGGSAAMVLPLTVCHAPKYRALRDYIARKTRVRACIRLPVKTFISYTAAQTAVLVVDHAHEQKTDRLIYIHLKSDGMSQDKKREPVPDNDMRALLECVSENRMEETPGAVEIRYDSGGSFLDFQQLFGADEHVWRLKELLTVKSDKTALDPDQWYAEPGLSSEYNQARVRGNLRQGRNLKGKKVIAKEGDLIIATLHINNGNGLFAVADRDYICASQIVASIRSDMVPPEYLIQALRREFPRQLIPTDLVGRETFTPEQILSVLIPKPSGVDLSTMRTLQENIRRLKRRLEEDAEKIGSFLP